MRRFRTKQTDTKGERSAAARSQELRVPTAIKVVFSIAMLLLILLHAMLPTFLVDSTTLVLVVLLVAPWLLPWIRSLEGGGFKIELGTSPASVPRAKANQEVAEAAEAVAQGFAVQLAPLLSGHQYLEIEDQALAALDDVLLPGWSMLPHQRINFPDGTFEDVDAIVRGPRGYRDTIVEVKLFLASKTTTVAVKQITRFNARIAALSERTHSSYQPLLLWAASDFFEPAPEVVRVIGEAVSGSGAFAGLFRPGRGRIAFAPGPPFFVEQERADRLGQPLTWSAPLSKVTHPSHVSSLIRVLERRVASDLDWLEESAAELRAELQPGELS